MNTRKTSASTEARRIAALNHLAPWVHAAAAGTLVQHIGAAGFRVVAKVALHATALHGFTLGDTGPVPKATLAIVAANALRCAPSHKAESAIVAALKDAGITDSSVIASTATAWITASLADGGFPIPLSGQSKRKAKAAPSVAPAPAPVADPVQSPVAAAVAQTVAQPAAIPVAIDATVGPAPIIIPVADLPEDVKASLSLPGGPLAEPVKAKVGRPRAGKVPVRDTPEWQEAARRSTAMAARPEANWQPASVVFGVQGLKGYVEVVESTHPNVPDVDPGFVFNKAILERVVASLSGSQGSIPMHAWFWGERGTGKTTLIEQIAARLRRPFFKVTFTRFTDASEIIGQTGLKDGNTYWTDGSILSALRCAEAPIILFDEFTLSQSGNVSGPINEIVHPLCKYHVPQTGEVVRYDPRTWFCVADNTNGSGDVTGRYTDTRQANRATVDRFFTFVRINRLADDEEVTLISHRAAVEAEVATKVQSLLKVLREKVDCGDIADPPSMREAIAFASMLRTCLLKPADAFEAAFAGKYPPEAQESMRSTFTAAWKADASEGAELSHPLQQQVEAEDNPF